MKLTRSRSTWTSSSSCSTSCSSTSLRKATWFLLTFCTRRSLTTSRTTTRLTTVLFQRSCPRPWSPLCTLLWCPVPVLLPVPSYVWLYGTVGLPKAVLLHSCLNGGQVASQISYWQYTLESTSRGTTTMHRCRLRSHPRVRSVIDSIQTRLDLVGNIWSPSSCEPLVQLAQSLLSVGRALD